MKKIAFRLIILFLGAQLVVSCSSENEVLSQFSKRKYLKKFKKEKVEYKDNIDEYKNISAENQYASTKNEIKIAETVIQDKEVVTIEKTVNYLENKKPIIKDYSEWRSYNRNIDLSDINNDFDFKANTNRNHKGYQDSEVNEVVLIILAIFIPPLAVYLYEDTITNNFWLDLILTLFFWLPGIIYAFLVIFGGISI